MTWITKLFFSFVFFSLVWNEVLFCQATPQVSATGRVTAEVISVFAASETSQMNFGKFSPGPEGGEIILTPQSTVSILGSILKDPELTTQQVFMSQEMLMLLILLHYLPARSYLLIHQMQKQ